MLDAEDERYCCFEEEDEWVQALLVESKHDGARRSRTVALPRAVERNRELQPSKIMAHPGL